MQVQVQVQVQMQAQMQIRSFCVWSVREEPSKGVERHQPRLQNGNSDGKIRDVSKLHFQPIQLARQIDTKNIDRARFGKSIKVRSVRIHRPIETTR